MANLIQHKRSSTSGVVPTSGNLSYGELGINYADGKLYTKRNDNTIINLAVSSISGTVITPASGYLQTIQFDTNAEPNLLKGQVCWNDTDGTLNVAVTDDTDIHVGEHKFYRVRNETGSVLYKGQAIYATGVHANGIITPSLYTANGSVREVRFMGLMLENLNSNNNGYAIDFGHLNIDTRGNVVSPIAVGDETWAAGDILYIHPTVAGKLTKVEPKHSISVAIVLSAASNGLLFVRPTSYGHIDDNHDVNTSGVTNNQYLRYDSATDYWVPTSSGIFNALSVSNDDGSSISLIDPDIDIYANEVLKLDAETSILLNTVANGNVGIGTDTPSGKLHVAGDLTVGVDGQNPKLKIIYDDNHVSGDGWDTLIELGRTQDMLRYNAFPLSLSTSGYGLSFQSNSDGVLFGMEQYTTGNFRPVIAWGDDTQDSPFVIRFNNNIRFQLSHDGNFTSVGSVTANSLVKSGGTSSQFLKADGSVDSTSYQPSSTALTTSTNFGGDVSGTYNNIVIADNSHNHIIGNVDGLQSALDLKAPLASPTFTGTPAAPTAASGTNTTQIATTAFVRTEISNLVDAAPGTLDTLNELAAALGDDPNFATTVTNSIATKANTNQTMYIGTTAVTINRSSGSLSLAGVSIDGNAGTATTSTTITANGTLTTQQGTGTVGYVAAIANGTSGLFPGSDNSNSVLTVNRHSGNYYSQLGFSSNGNLYYRKFNNVAIDTTTPWQTIWTSSSLTNLNQLTNGPGYTTNTGTVTSVAALTIGTTGTDITSTVANGTTTPVITLNIPTASASNRGALSSTDWTTFNNKVSTSRTINTTSPITGGGDLSANRTIALASAYGDTLNPYGSKTANYFLASPNGSAGVPSFRAIVAADIPTLNQNTTGSAATLTTSRTLWGQSFNGSANVTGDMSNVGKIEQYWSDQRIGIFYSNSYRNGIALFANSRLTTIFSTTGDSTGGAITFNTRAGVGSSDTDYGTERMRITNNGDVGIGTTTPSYKLQVNGSFGATTKSFRIDHPSKPNYTLEYGSLESPYHGVRLTGRGTVVKGSGVVVLPPYLKDLIHDDETINIQITNIKHGKTVYVDNIDLNNDQFTVRVDRAKTLGTLEFFWTFTGTRKDVDKLVVEAEK